MSLDFSKLLIVIVLAGVGVYIYFDWNKRSEQSEIAAHQREQEVIRERLASEKQLLEAKAKAEADSLELKAKYERERLENLRQLEAEKVKVVEAQQVAVVEQERVQAAKTEAVAKVQAEVKTTKLVEDQKAVSDLRLKLAATNKSIEEARTRATEARKLYVIFSNEAEVLKSQIARTEDEINELNRLKASSGYATNSGLKFDMQGDIQRKTATRQAQVDKRTSLLSQANKKAGEQKKANDDADALGLAAKRIDESIKKIIDASIKQ